jgi:hypothetical protein
MATMPLAVSGSGRPMLTVMDLNASVLVLVNAAPPASERKRLGRRLPERLRLPPTCRRNVVPTRDPKCLKNLETNL